MLTRLLLSVPVASLAGTAFLLPGSPEAVPFETVEQVESDEAGMVPVQYGRYDVRPLIAYSYPDYALPYRPYSRPYRPYSRPYNRPRYRTVRDPYPLPFAPPAPRYTTYRRYGWDGNYRRYRAYRGPRSEYGSRPVPLPYRR